MMDDAARSILSGREFGPNEPLSIATSVAIDSIMGRIEEANDKYAPILDHDLFMVHTRTLYRNLIGSVPTEERKRLTPYVLAEALSTEMRIIETVVSEASQGKCTVEFYHCDYRTILNDFKKSLPRLPTTPGQKDAKALEYATLNAFKNDLVSKPPVEYFNRKFPDKGSDALIFTHYPVDLLNRYRFKSLKLLESHTGAIKPFNVWNTKLREGWGLEPLPFDQMTLQMFGDNVHFSPMHKKVRMTVFNIAVKNKWTYATTKDYVLYCIQQNRDPALEALVRELYSGG